MDRTKNERINDILTEVLIHTKRMNNREKMAVCQSLIKTLLFLANNDSLDSYLGEMDVDEEYRGELIRATTDMYQQLSDVLDSSKES